jgi:hypothetical protein
MLKIKSRLKRLREPFDRPIILRQQGQTLIECQRTLSLINLWKTGPEIEEKTFRAISRKEGELRLAPFSSPDMNVT